MVEKSLILFTVVLIGDLSLGVYLTNQSLIPRIEQPGDQFPWILIVSARSYELFANLLKIGH
jgi:hypothetical protein